MVFKFEKKLWSQMGKKSVRKNKKRQKNKRKEKWKQMNDNLETFLNTNHEFISVFT